MTVEDLFIVGFPTQPSCKMHKVCYSISSARNISSTNLPQQCVLTFTSAVRFNLLMQKTLSTHDRLNRPVDRVK